MYLFRPASAPDRVTRVRSARLRGAAVSLGLLVVSNSFQSNVVAQEVGSSGESKTAAVASDDRVEEVVVTAQFHRQAIQETPLAITAVTSEMMEAQGQKNLMDVAERVPGVTFSSGGLGGSQASQVSIRGIGQTDFNLAVEPGVGIYVDDVYYGTVYGSLLQLLDLDRVEVLRGPQGTLAGKNSEGSAIKLFTKQPNDQGEGLPGGDLRFLQS